MDNLEEAVRRLTERVTALEQLVEQQRREQAQFYKAFYSADPQRRQTGSLIADAKLAGNVGQHLRRLQHFTQFDVKAPESICTVKGLKRLLRTYQAGAVYFLVWHDTVVYAGRTAALWKRIYGHANKWFECVFYIPMRDGAKRKQAEAYYIKRLRPLFNKTVTDPRPLPEALVAEIESFVGNQYYMDVIALAEGCRLSVDALLEASLTSSTQTGQVP